MRDFISGLQLNELFFHQIVGLILEVNFPNLQYSAGLIGWGSEILGFDDIQSTDHNWGLRFQLFLSEQNYAKYSDSINEIFELKLPETFENFPTNLAIHVNQDQRGTPVSGKHNIDIETIDGFFGRYLGRHPGGKITAQDWLTFPEHKLLGVTTGKVFADKSGKLEYIRQKFRYYPKDIWLYLLASQWQKIFEEQSFVGRCGQVGDELGSKIIATRQIKNLMRLCFLIEQKYAPYSKWFGTAFSRLNCAKELKLIFESVLEAKNWQERQDFLGQGYRAVIRIFNGLQIVKPMSEDVSYFGRPFLIIKDEIIIQNLREIIADSEVKNICYNLGSINQFVDSDDQITDIALCGKLKMLY